MNNYILAVDGAYSSKFNQMGIGILFIKDDKEIIRYSNSYKGGTNNIAEMMALLVGLRMIKNSINSLTIYSDSMYVIGCLIKNWSRKKNTKLWNILDKEYARILELCNNIEFIHVKGHQSGSNLSKDAQYNNIVDNLAQSASKLI